MLWAVAPGHESTFHSTNDHHVTYFSANFGMEVHEQPFILESSFSHTAGVVHKFEPAEIEEEEVNKRERKLARPKQLDSGKVLPYPLIALFCSDFQALKDGLSPDRQFSHFASFISLNIAYCVFRN
jgi:hypothetical protein